MSEHVLLSRLALHQRVPHPVGLAAELKQETTGDAVNAAMKQAAEGRMKGYLAYTDDPLVSADIISDPHSGVIDGQSTGVVGGRMVRVLVWYDNEFAYAKRMVDIASYMASRE